MRLLRAVEPFDHPAFVYEPKIDGFRALAHLSDARVLSDHELRTLWQRLADAEANESLPAAVSLWLRLRLLTAQRGGSVARMKWADIDFDRKVWEIPATDMKAGKAHVVPLSPFAIRLLQARGNRVTKESVYVLEGDLFTRLAKAQSQCRTTVETLALIKGGPRTVFARQANIAGGPQQVNNGVPPPGVSAETCPEGSRVRAENPESRPIELLEAHVERVDSGAAETAGSGDLALAAVGTVNRTANR